VTLPFLLPAAVLLAILSTSGPMNLNGTMHAPLPCMPVALRFPQSPVDPQTHALSPSKAVSLVLAVAAPPAAAATAAAPPVAAPPVAAPPVAALSVAALTAVATVALAASALVLAETPLLLLAVLVAAVAAVAALALA
jgi:hypothetical protein